MIVVVPIVVPLLWSRRRFHRVRRSVSQLRGKVWGPPEPARPEGTKGTLLRREKEEEEEGHCEI